MMWMKILHSVSLILFIDCLYSTEVHLKFIVNDITDYTQGEAPQL